MLAPRSHDTRFPGPDRPRVARLFTIGALLLGSLLLLASARPAGSQQPAGSPEITSQESSPSFRLQSERNLVIVRVVVRDSNSRLVENLRQEDFRVSDNGKPQSISHFSVEIPSAKNAGASPADVAAPNEDEEVDGTKSSGVANRYTGLFFDDVHISIGDLVRSREAAKHFLAGALQLGDRVGIFTASGQHQLDFTDDRGKMHEALNALFPHPIVPRQQDSCPEISDLQAYKMVHMRDFYAIEIAVEEAMICNPVVNSGNQAQARAEAQRIAESEAFQELNFFQTETAQVLRGLEGLVRRLAIMPGQRSIVLVSPGFLQLTAERSVADITDRALRSSIVINALDAQGLYAASPLGGADHKSTLPTQNMGLVGKKTQFALDRIGFAAEVMRDLAADTGGVFFHNNNDLDEGFRRTLSFPELFYVLAFSPQNLKSDGKFHTLKVTLNTRQKYSVQARSGYFAPEKPGDPAAQAKEEIERAIFSQDDVNELPVAVNTQFFKVSDTQVKLAVVTRVDLGLFRFRKENGRNLNSLTMVTALFDRDGKYMMAKEKRVQFQLLDASLAKLAQSGITSKTTFDVSPGTYMVRQVVRDSEGVQLSALSRTVEIAF